MQGSKGNCLLLDGLACAAPPPIHTEPKVTTQVAEMHLYVKLINS